MREGEIVVAVVTDPGAGGGTCHTVCATLSVGVQLIFHPNNLI